jgi:hypothetical protein
LGFAAEPGAELTTTGVAMPLPVGRSTSMRAFLCRRSAGNLVIYGSPALADERDDIGRLGGAWRHYLTHSHETEFVAEAVGDGPFIHVADSEVLAHAHARHRTFAGRHVLGEDFQLIRPPATRPAIPAICGTPGRNASYSAETRCFCATVSGRRRF